MANYHYWEEALHILDPPPIVTRLIGPVYMPSEGQPLFIGAQYPAVPEAQSLAVQRHAIPGAPTVEPRLRLRHYFTNSSPWHTRIPFHYAAYCPDTGMFVDSHRWGIPDPDAGPPEWGRNAKITIKNHLFFTPVFDPKRPRVIPKWRRVLGFSFYADFRDDVFFFSSGNFPCHHGLVRTGLEKTIAHFSHTPRLPWISGLQDWFDQIQKVAICAPMTGVRPYQFRLQLTDRRRLVALQRVQVIYLVVPRDPHCRFGDHRTWHGPGVLFGRDGFMTHYDFRRLHAQMDEDADFAPKHCNCCLDPDPTNGAIDQLRELFLYRPTRPHIVAVIGDIHGHNPR